MKKIFSTLLLVILFPIRQIKKIKKDNFLLGLIFGALFSLIVNIISMQIQGKVDKQRVFEAIENEIVSNLIQASGNLSTANRQSDKDANPFITVRKFSRDIWEQSIEPLQYVAQLDSKNQILINSYYSYLIPETNAVIDMRNALYIKSMEDCYNFNRVLTANEKEICNRKYHSYLDLNALYNSDDVFKKSSELLKTFHPTQDRLNSPILKFLMGSESMRILSGE